eukprot:gene7566-biopygen16564
MASYGVVTMRSGTGPPCHALAPYGSRTFQILAETEQNTTNQPRPTTNPPRAALVVLCCVVLRCAVLCCAVL